MNPKKIQDLANQGQQHFQANRLTEARDCYLKISQQVKNNPGIWMVLGAIDGKAGHFKTACEFFSKAIKLAPGQAEGYLNLANAQSAMNEFQLAEKNYRKTLSIQPELAHVWMLIAHTQNQQQDHHAAIQSLQEALKRQPIYPEAHNSMGLMLQRQGHIDDAIACYKTAIEQRTNYAIAHYNLGTIMHESGQYTEASRAFHQAIQINPQYIEAYIALGLTIGFTGSVKDSSHCFQKALDIDPDNIEALVNLARARALQGHPDQAITLYQRAASLAPEQIEAITGQVHILERKGLFKEAEHLIQPLLDNATDDASVAIAFATLSRRINRRDEAKSLLEGILQNMPATIPLAQYPDIHFSLARIYQDQKSYDLAFKQFQQANYLLPYHFDLNEHKQYIDQIMQYGNRTFLDSIPCSTLNTSQPIFILGMPRSGTSLIEQIIASHPQVHGGGELSFISDISKNMPEQIGSSLPFPACISELTQDSINQLSQFYLSQIHALDAEATYITDKMPHNFLYLGLIERLLPQARIIHCKRNSIDTCLSIYTQNFTANHPYNKDLTQLGQYYLEYERLMQYWHQNLNIPIFNIQYEELINDQENMTHKLIEFCGLEWDDACINFHKSGRHVATPSYDQVRQPMYKSAIERWRCYEPYLQPLLTALKIRS